MNSIQSNSATADLGTLADIFMRDASLYPPISPEQSRTLGRAAKAGDTTARETLINHTTQLVASLACQYARTYNAWGDLEDLLGVGSLGLMQSWKSYNPDEGAFSTHATYFIERNINVYFHPRRRDVPEIILLDLESANHLSTEDTYSAIDNKVVVAQLLEAANLKPYETEVIKRRYGIGLDEEQNFSQIGESGSKKVSRERVRQVYDKAMSKIRSQAIAV